MKQVIFNTENVRAILCDQKTETRRIMRKQPAGTLYQTLPGSCFPGCWRDAESMMVLQPPFRAGQILWVRETWARVGKDVCPIFLEHGETLSHGQSIYRADGWDFKKMGIWHPAIFMPHDAARIFLRVVDVFPQRLHDMDEEQAKAEGANVAAGIEEKMKRSAIERFAEIWNRTIRPADRALYGWDANPYVWAVKFRRISKEEALACEN